MMTKFLTPAATAAMLFLPALAGAQQIDSPYRFLEHGQHVGVTAGYAFLSDGPLDMGPAEAPVVAAGWSYRVSGPFAIGASAFYIPTTRSVRDSVLLADSTFRPIGTADMHILGLMANLRLNIMGSRTWNGLHPYGEFGVGLVLDLAGTSEADAELPSEARFDLGTSFAGQAGAGVEWFPSQRFAIRADARSLLWKLEVPQAFLLSAPVRNRGLAGSEWHNNLALSAGVSIYF